MTDDKLRQEAAAAAKTVGLNNPNCVSRDTFITGYLAHAAKAGVLSHLSEQAPEFDASECSGVFGQRYAGGVHQLEGARWMHDQMKAREAALRAEVEQLKAVEYRCGECGNTVVVANQTNYLDEIERLKRELAELQDGKETMSRFLHEKRMSAECERSAKLRAEVEKLKRNAWNKSDDVLVHENTELTKEVERLKRELAEANACARGSADLACSKGEQLTAERERATKLASAVEEHLYNYCPETMPADLCNVFAEYKQAKGK